ncbi:MAG: hypothetical protein R3A12_00225 [Ignavibacteria bacterium]
MYFNASAQNLASIDSLEDAFNTTYQTQVSSEIFSRSKIFGENIASAIYNWSVTDGGNEGQLHNTDPVTFHRQEPATGFRHLHQMHRLFSLTGVTTVRL